MNLTSIEKNRTYTISKLNVEDETVLIQLKNLKLLEGASVKLIRKAPWFKDPLIVEIENSQIVISANEASLVEVSEVRS